MNSSDSLSDLLADFVFRDRRIVDQDSLRISVMLVEGDDPLTLRRVATAGDWGVAPRDILVRRGDGIPGRVFSERKLAVAPDNSARLESSDDSIRSLIACPIFVGGTPAGVLNLHSFAQVDFTERDVNRMQVLSALVAYELFHLGERIRVRSQISEDLGRVLRSAREELRVTQEDLAAMVGTSRVAVSRWESGAQPPSRGPLRRWASALGILAGGRREIITVVDSTRQLLDVLRHDPVRLSELSPEQFEIFVAERLDRMGYLVQRTGTTTLRDGGIDIIALPKNPNVASFLLAVQVKHHRSGRPTGRDAVDRLLAWQDTAFRLGMLVTNTRFTKDAIWTASRDPARHFLRLRDFPDLTHWLHGVFNSESELREIPDSIELAPGVSVQIPKPQFSEVGVIWPLENMLSPKR